MGEHPLKDLRRILRDLQLRQLLPHFFLAAAQIGDVVAKDARPRQEGPAEKQNLLDGLGDGRAPAKHVAQVDQVIARPDALVQVPVQDGEPRRLAVDGGHRPASLGGTQYREFRIVGHGGARGHAAA